MQEHKHCCGGGLASPTAVDLSGWQKIVTKIAKDLHSGKIKPTDLSKDYINKTSETLREGIRKGYGKVNYNKGDIENIISMMRNAHIFSTYKNADFQQKVASKLYDKDGKPKPFHEFKQEVLKLNKSYNKTYLQAEYLTAKRSAQAVKQWEDVQRRKHLYPNLEYKTVGDNHVRDEHAVLNGKIRAIEHSFWDTYYPPNGWRCRCYVVQTDKPSNGDDVPPVTEKNVPKMFQRNVGKDRMVFGEEHPYFNQVVKDGNISLASMIVANEVRKSAKFELIKQFKNGSSVWVSPFADTEDRVPNVFTALLLAKSEKNAKVEIMYHLTNAKNPELRFMGVIGDRVEIGKKNTNPANVVRNAFSQKYGKNGQLRDFKESVLVVDYLDRKLTYQEIFNIARRLNGDMKKRVNNKMTFLIINNKVHKIDRTVIDKGDGLNNILKRILM